MMECHQDPLRLMEYAEGTLEGPEARRLETHLVSCELCRRELDSWLRVEGALHALPLVAEPAGFKSAVMGRIEEVRPVQLWHYDGQEGGLAVAIAAMVFAVATVLAMLAGSVDGATVWRWQHEAAIWMELYLQSGFSNLLLAGAIFVAALAVAGIGVLSEEMRRTSVTA